MNFGVSNYDRDGPHKKLLGAKGIATRSKDTTRATKEADQLARQHWKVVTRWEAKFQPVTNLRLAHSLGRRVLAMKQVSVVFNNLQHSWRLIWQNLSLVRISTEKQDYLELLLSCVQAKLPLLVMTAWLGIQEFWRYVGWLLDSVRCMKLLHSLASSSNRLLGCAITWRLYGGIHEKIITMRCKVHGSFVTACAYGAKCWAQDNTSWNHHMESSSAKSWAKLMLRTLGSSEKKLRRKQKEHLIQQFDKLS